MAKIKVTEESFLNWYFSDDNDKLVFANNAIAELKTHGKVLQTVQTLLDNCGYVPGFIAEAGEGVDESDEYEPEEVELINTRVQKMCTNCGQLDDESMDNFCPNCLTSK